MFAENFETLVVFMKYQKKNWNHLVPRVGPPSAPAPASATRAHPRHQVVSIYFIFAIHETTKVSNFLKNIFVKPPKIQTIIHETRFPKKKWVVSY